MPTTIKVFYGVEGKYKDVTELTEILCVDGNILNIPSGEYNRCGLYGDPLPGILKHMKVDINNIDTILAPDRSFTLNLTSDIIFDYKPSIVRFSPDDKIRDPIDRLENFHRNLKFNGDIRTEYPEQLMAVMFIKPNDKVLELGSNVGRNTLTIATILSDQNNLVTLECDPKSFKILLKHRDANDYYFRAENSALSKSRLAQKDWDTVPFENDIPKGFVEVSTISFVDLQNKYDIKFDTLVADCEGALYYIFQDFPEMLDGISKIIMENDYNNIDHKNKVNEIMKSKGFVRIYHQGGGWGPCKAFFYEVWEK